MPESFLPKPDSFKNFQPVSQNDYKFIEAFDDLATIINGCNESENITLLLSSCRNPYFLINSLFEELKLILGWGPLGSKYDLAMLDIAEERTESAQRRLDEISRHLNAFTQKILVWEKRQDLYNEFNSRIDSLKPVAQRRIKEILSEVRTRSVNALINPWDPILFEIDLDGNFSQDLLSKKQCLDRSHITILMAKNLARALAKLIQSAGKNLSLLPTYNTEWVSLLEEVNAIADEINWLIRVEESDDAITIIPWNSEGKPYILTKSLPSVHEIDSTKEILLKLLYAIGNRVYSNLKTDFIPNRAAKKIPDPFIIDFGKISSRTEQFDYKVIPAGSLTIPRPSTVKIALPTWGIPGNYYHTDNLDLKLFPSDISALKGSLLAAIKTAKDCQANALILPEFFIPRVLEEEITQTASSNNIALIGGLEAKTNEQGKIVNEVIVSLPGHPRYFRQRKHHPSQAEPNTDRFLKGDKVYYFTNTTLGNFAVFVCSDYREFSLHKEIILQPYPGIIFVCALNHATRLFEAMAIADSDRYYSHVVICNNYSDKESASSHGTLVASPVRQSDSYVKYPQNGKLQALNCPKVAGQEMNLWLIDLDLNAIACRDRGTMADGYRRPPWCRR